MYHYLTRDIIVNEVVMRADPQGRTVGEIIRDDIAGPLGLRDQVHQLLFSYFFDPSSIFLVLNSIYSWPWVKRLWFTRKMYFPLSRIDLSGCWCKCVISSLGSLKRFTVWYIYSCWMYVVVVNSHDCLWCTLAALAIVAEVHCYLLLLYFMSTSLRVNAKFTVCTNLLCHVHFILKTVVGSDGVRDCPVPVWPQLCETVDSVR